MTVERLTHRASKIIRQAQHNTRKVLALGNPQNYFSPARPGRVVEAPFVFYSWPKMQTERWTYTGYLMTENQQRFGFEFVIYKRLTHADHLGLVPIRWLGQEMFISQMTITDIDGNGFRFAERGGLLRKMPGFASSEHFYVRCDDWFMTEINGRHHLVAEEHTSAASWGINLELTPVTPLVAHGVGGYTRKGLHPDNGCFYVSYPKLDINGTILIDGKVTRAQGSAWMDHEKMSTRGDVDQVGWDWLRFQFNDNSQLMIHQLRRRDGSVDRFSSGTFIKEDGSVIPLVKKDFKIQVTQKWKSGKTKIRWPSHWTVTIPHLDLRLEVSPHVQNQEINTIKNIALASWKGAVTVKGTRSENPIKGEGFVELVGYDTRISRKIVDILLAP